MKRRKEADDKLLAAMSTLTIIESIEAKLKTAIATGVVPSDEGFDGFCLVRLGDEVAQSLQIQWGSADAEHAVAEGAKSAQEMERGGRESVSGQ